MNRSLLLAVTLCISFILIGCSSTPYQNINIQETWQREIQNNPNRWVSQASPWFLKGDISASEAFNRRAGYSTAMSNMTVSVPNFNNIKITGNFQVQLFGAKSRNSVYLLGSNNSLRQISVTVQNGTLFLTQLQSYPGMRNVIVRIGVCELRRLVLQGAASVEGIRLYSRDLKVLSRGTGNIYLSGNLNLRKVIKVGCGSINIFGVNTNSLDITANAPGGSLNLCGRVGLNSIMNIGGSAINIIGGFSCGLKIYAEGTGFIGISPGMMRNKGINLSDVCVKKCARVYIGCVSSPNLRAFVYDNATLGLAGIVQNINLTTYDYGNFFGKQLCAVQAYVKAYGRSHVNIEASTKIFANSNQNSTIYFFGPPDLMAPFVSGSGSVIPIWSGGARSCFLPSQSTPPISAVYRYGPKRLAPFPSLEIPVS